MNPSIALTGATGLIGRRLAAALAADGFDVRALTRSPERSRFSQESIRPIGWDGVHPSSAALAGARAVVHLAGEPVMAGPLTASRRRRIFSSRVDSAAAIVEGMAALPASERPDVLISASAVGYYGDRGEESLGEAAGSGDGFLAEVCRAWEAAALPARELGVRVVTPRIGIVLAREGGALALMTRIFRLGLGGQLGSGKQWVPWIHVDDVVGLVRLALDAPLEGALNAVAPNPVRNEELTRVLARTLRRPAVFRVPAFGLRVALGELSSELLGSHLVAPDAALAAGYRFQHEDLESALEAELLTR